LTYDVVGQMPNDVVGQGTAAGYLVLRTPSGHLNTWRLRGPCVTACGRALINARPGRCSAGRALTRSVGPEFSPGPSPKTIFRRA